MLCTCPPTHPKLQLYIPIASQARVQLKVGGSVVRGGSVIETVIVQLGCVLLLLPLIRVGSILHASAITCSIILDMFVHSYVCRGAFMEVLENKVWAGQVDNVSEILAPVVYKALQVARDPEPPMDWPAGAMGEYMVPAEVTNSTQHVLLRAVARGFGPKVFPRCITEHVAMVDGIEKVITQLMPADHRGSDKPGPLTETEMVGILMAFDHMPLSVDTATGRVRRAAEYSTMDKGRGFLLWGYTTKRITCTDLSEGMFTIEVVKDEEVKDALCFFGLTSSDAFNTFQGHVQQAALHAVGSLAQAMIHRPAVPGGPVLAVPRGPELAFPGGAAAWQIHWPSLFMHCCEVKQTLNAFGRARVEIVTQHRTASSKVLQHLFGGYSGTDPFMMVLVRHAMTARVKLGRKQPQIEALADKPAKQSKLSSSKLSSNEPAHTPATSGCQQTPGKESAVPQTKNQLPDHGSPTPILCQCSGMCAIGSPMCPARLFWSRRDARRAKGCPNYAVVRNHNARRHYCLSCLCQTPKCCYPRRRGLYCSVCAKKHKVPRDAFLGWTPARQPLVSHWCQVSST